MGRPNPFSVFHFEFTKIVQGIPPRGVHLKQHVGRWLRDQYVPGVASIHHTLGEI